MDRGISCRFVVDLGPRTPISLVVRSACVVFLRVVDLSDCSDLLDCVIVSGDSVLSYGLYLWHHVRGVANTDGL